MPERPKLHTILAFLSAIGLHKVDIKYLGSFWSRKTLRCSFAVSTLGCAYNKVGVSKKKINESASVEYMYIDSP